MASYLSQLHKERSSFGVEGVFTEYYISIHPLGNLPRNGSFVVSGKSLELWDSSLQVGLDSISYCILNVFCLFVQLFEVQGSGALVQSWHEIFEASFWLEINLRRTGQTTKFNICFTCKL